MTCSGVSGVASSCGSAGPFAAVSAAEAAAADSSAASGPRPRRASPRRPDGVTGATSSPASSMRATSATTSSSVAPTASRHDAAEMREVGGGGRAGDLELHDLAAHAFERVARAADLRGRARVNCSRRPDDALVERRASRSLSASRSAHVVVEQLLGVADRRAQLLAADLGPRDVGAAAADARVEIARGFIEPRDVGVERGGALDRAPPARCGPR